MPMSEEVFERLVNRLDVVARKQPGIYQIRVALLAFLGYLYVFLVLTVLVGMLVAIGIGCVF